MVIKMPSHNVGQRFYSKGIPAGNAAARPGLSRQITKKAHRRPPDSLERPDMAGPGKLVGPRKYLGRSSAADCRNHAQTRRRETGTPAPNR